MVSRSTGFENRYRSTGRRGAVTFWNTAFEDGLIIRLWSRHQTTRSPGRGAETGRGSPALGPEDGKPSPRLTSGVANDDNEPADGEPLGGRRRRRQRPAGGGQAPLYRRASSDIADACRQAEHPVASRLRAARPRSPSISTSPPRSSTSGDMLRRSRAPRVRLDISTLCEDSTVAESDINQFGDGPDQPGGQCAATPSDEGGAGHGPASRRRLRSTFRPSPGASGQPRRLRRQSPLDRRRQGAPRRMTRGASPRTVLRHQGRAVAGHRPRPGARSHGFAKQ